MEKVHTKETDDRFTKLTKVFIAKVDELCKKHGYKFSKGWSSLITEWNFSNGEKFVNIIGRMKGKGRYDSNIDLVMNVALGEEKSFKITEIEVYSKGDGYFGYPLRSHEKEKASKLPFVKASDIQDYSKALDNAFNKIKDFVDGGIQIGIMK